LIFHFSISSNMRSEWLKSGANQHWGDSMLAVNEALEAICETAPG